MRPSASPDDYPLITEPSINTDGNDGGSEANTHSINDEEPSTNLGEDGVGVEADHKETINESLMDKLFIPKFLPTTALVMGENILDPLVMRNTPIGYNYDDGVHNDGEYDIFKDDNPKFFLDNFEMYTTPPNGVPGLERPGTQVEHIGRVGLVGPAQTSPEVRKVLERITRNRRRNLQIANLDQNIQLKHDADTLKVAKEVTRWSNDVENNATDDGIVSKLASSLRNMRNGFTGIFTLENATRYLAYYATLQSAQKHVDIDTGTLSALGAGGIYEDEDEDEGEVEAKTDEEEDHLQ